MTKRDKVILFKIQHYQNLLKDTIKEFRVTKPSDLGNIHPIMRRGMVQTVGDIFELTVPLSSNVELPLNREIIKQFRNTASHNYGQITNELAYACILHCIDKHLVSAVNKAVETQ